MQLDVVIDVVCPWCYLGKRQLDKALEMRPGLITDVRYRPYQLGPDTPPEGVDRTEYYAKKFGDSPQLKAGREHLLKVGETLGITFDFESKCTIGNTLDAHRLIRWAYSSGVQAEVADRIMQLYFEECQFIGDRELLVSVAVEKGMDGALVADLLASDKDIAEVKGELAAAQQMGVTGVPMFIFDNKAGVSGAQEANVLVNVMDKLQSEKQAS